MSTIPSPDVSAALAEPASRRRRFQYSVRTLSIATILVLLAISHLATSFQLWKLRRDMQRMRGEVGLLDIGDRTKVHAVAIRDGRLNTWRWRVYVPPNKRIALCYSIGESKPDHFPRSRGGMNLEAGDHIVAASLFKNAQDQWRLAVGAPGAMEMGFGGDHVLATPLGASIWAHSVSGKTVAMTDGEPLVLVRLVAKRMPPGVAPTWGRKESGDGFQIWLDESTFE
jgi:hypothetical protein